MSSLLIACSFYFAEVLKYLYLSFAETDVVSLDEFVLTLGVTLYAVRNLVALAISEYREKMCGLRWIVNSSRALYSKELSEK